MPFKRKKARNAYMKDYMARRRAVARKGKPVTLADQVRHLRKLLREARAAVRQVS